MRKQSWTEDEHRAMGRQLKEMTKPVSEIHETVLNRMPLKSRATRLSRKLYCALQELRSELDNIAGVDCSELSNADFVSIYYGQGAPTQEAEK